MDRIDDVDRVEKRSGLGAGIIVAVIAIAAVIAAFAFGLIDINQTKETKLPEVAVEGGQAPAFDVDTAKVDVGTKETNVTVPTVDVGTKDAAVKIPTLDVEKAK